MSEFKNSAAVVNAIRYAVKAQGTWSQFVTDNGITRETVLETSKVLAGLAFPSDEPVQVDPNGKRTRYGNAVQAAKAGMNYALGKVESDDEPKTQALLTKAGFAATLEEVTAAWQSAQV